MSNLIKVPKDNLNNFGKESEIKALFDECWDFSFRNWSPWLQASTEDMAAFLGAQWNPQDKSFLRMQKRNALVFNKIRRVIKMVTGFERKSRHSLIAQPIEGGDEESAEALSNVLIWLMQHENISHTMSDCFEAALKTSANLASIGIDFNEDMINGDLKLHRVPYNAFLLDPRFTRRDLKDCEYIMQRRQVSREGAKALLPFRADEIDNLPTGDSDDRFPYMQQYADTRSKDIMRYDEFYIRKFKEVEMFVDRETGQTLEFEKKDLAGRREQVNFMLQSLPQLQQVTRSIPTVEMNILINGHVMWSGDDPLGIGDYPHVLVAAFWDPEFADQAGNGDYSLKLQSLVRPMRDPQTEVNKRRSKMLDILDSQLNSGWIVKNNAVVNPKDLYQSGQGKVVYLNKDSSMADIQRVPPAEFGTGIFQLAQLFDQDVQDVSGATDELLGQPDNASQISGETVKMRQGAALTIQQDLFDNFRLSQKQLGQKLIKAILHNYNAGKIERITGEPVPEQLASLLPSFRDDEELNGKRRNIQNTVKFDVSVQESVETPSQRALAYQQVLQATNAGILPKEIGQKLALDLLPIQNLKEVRQEIEASQQQAQAQQAKIDEQEQLIRQLQQAKMFSDVGLGVERMARAEADRGLARERISEMQENNSKAALNKAKFIKELQGMEIDQLSKLMALATQLEDQNVQQAENLADQQRSLSAMQLNEAVEFVSSPAQGPGQQEPAQQLEQQLT